MIIVAKSQKTNKVMPILRSIFHLPSIKQPIRITIETSKIPDQYEIPALFILITELGLTITVEKNHGNPKQNNKSKILLPIEFEMAISAVPFFVIIIVDMTLYDLNYLILNFFLN